MYDKRESPFVMMTWQENSLMLAEAILRSGGAGDALLLVNNVRASHLYNGLPIAPWLPSIWILFMIKEIKNCLLEDLEC